jgi:hypothetical protein
MTVATGFALEASIAAPLPVFAVTKSWPETLAFVALMLPATVSFPVILSLPPMVTVEPLWLMIELLTLALPPLLEKSGTKLVLQAVPDKQMISFACSANLRNGWTTNAYSVSLEQQLAHRTANIYTCEFQIHPPHTQSFSKLGLSQLLSSPRHDSV